MCSKYSFWTCHGNPTRDSFDYSSNLLVHCDSATGSILSMESKAEKCGVQKGIFLLQEITKVIKIVALHATL